MVGLAFVGEELAEVGALLSTGETAAVAVAACAAWTTAMASFWPLAGLSLACCGSGDTARAVVVSPLLIGSGFGEPLRSSIETTWVAGPDPAVTQLVAPPYLGLDLPMVS